MSKSIFIPRPYQKIAIAHMLDHNRNAPWLGMGLGKTAISLEVISILHALSEVRRVLVVAPLRVAKTTWVNEADKWENFEHLSLAAIVGTPDERKRALNTRAVIHTINYENLPWLMQQLGDEWPFDMVIADEATKLKGVRVDIQTSKLGKRFMRSSGTKRSGVLAKQAFRSSYWSNLTGTPAPNGLKDLWGPTWFLDKGQRLGRTHGAFMTRWFQRGFDGYSIDPLPHADEEIHARLGDICLSMEAKDHFNLPDTVYNTIYVDLPPKAMAIYRDMEKRMFIELQSGTNIEAFHAAAKTMKCLQIANGAVYDEDARWHVVHDAKLDALEDVIEEAAGMPVIVAYHFKSDLKRLQERFPKGRYFDTKASTLADFRQGKILLLFLHPESAGHGVDGLQDGTNAMVFFGNWWDLEKYQQAIERIGAVRQFSSGYDRPVFIHHLVARNTIDELVMLRRETKRDVQDLLMEAMKRA